MEKIIVFDGDPGTDDAIALRILSLSAQKPYWCISTFGNMPWNYTCLNMHLLSRSFGMESGIACGVRVPYDGHTVNCSNFHGTDGLGDTSESLMRELEIDKDIVNSSASLADVARSILSCESVIYVVTGPLSSLSHLLDDYPEVKSHIKRVYVMGGGVREFNVDGNKEYNFAADGIAVEKVFSSSLDITLFPLDITHHFAKLSLQQIESIDFTSAPFLKSVLNTNYRSNSKYGITDAVLHDALPVLYLLEPEKFDVEDMKLSADSTGRIRPSEEGRVIHVAVSCPATLLYASVKGAIESKEKQAGL